MAHSHRGGLSAFHSLPLEVLRNISGRLIGIQDPIPDAEPKDLAFHSDAIDFVGLCTIARLARTCHLFHEPALEALWDTVPSYGFLVYTLPRDAWTAVRNVVDPGAPPYIPVFTYVSATRPWREENFERVNHYAPRVKRIQSTPKLFPDDSVNSVVFQPSILHAFVTYYRPRPVLPNLYALEAYPHVDRYCRFHRFIPIFFGPKLESFESHCAVFSSKVQQENGNDYEYMLTRLQETVPRLLGLRLCVNDYGSEWTPRVAAAVSVLLCNFEHLVSIRTGWLPIATDALTQLAALRSLRSLEIRLDDAVTDEHLGATLQANGDGSCFASLQEACLYHASSLTVLSTFIRRIASSLLEDILVKVFARKSQMHVNFEHIIDILACLASRNDSERIKTVVLDVQADRADRATLEEHHLEPLFALRNLTHLALDIHRPFDINDAILRRVADSWSNLRVLELGPDPLQTSSNGTISGLRHLVYGTGAPIFCPSV